MPSGQHGERGYPCLLLQGAPEAIDVMIGELFEQGCLGIESIDDGAPQRAYFPPGTDLAVLRDQLALRFPDVHAGPIETIPEQDWVVLSRKDMSAYALGERFLVCPSWESLPRAAKTPRQVLRLDPEQAFGTGRHDTTRLCVELLESCAHSGAGAIDVGTGTGILAMVAATLGCRPVVAIEIDPVAAACARDNVKRNHLEAHIEVWNADFEAVTLPPAGLVVANLHRPLLDRQMARLANWLAPPAFLLLSGFTTHDLDELAAMLDTLPRPLRLARYCTAGEWAALLATTHRVDSER